MQCLYSPNGLYRLCLEANGDLIAYDMTSVSVGGTSFWSTGTANAVSCTMQTDGNFACYDQYHSIVWSTGTSGKGVGPSYYLALQNDRNVVLYDSSNNPLWTSNTRLQILTGNLRIDSRANECLDIYYEDIGRPLQEEYCNQNGYYYGQPFSFVPSTTAGFYKILSPRLLCVDVTDASVAILSTCNDHASQLWKINHVGNNLFQLQPSHALQQNKCLDWNNIQISNCSTVSEQAWSIAIPVASGALLIFLFITYL